MNNFPLVLLCKTVYSFSKKIEEGKKSMDCDLTNHTLDDFVLFSDHLGTES